MTVRSTSTWSAGPGRSMSPRPRQCLSASISRRPNANLWSCFRRRSRHDTQPRPRRVPRSHLGPGRPRCRGRVLDAALRERVKGTPLRAGARTPDRTSPAGIPARTPTGWPALFHARAAATDFGAPTVSHPDPDTLSLRTRSFDGRDAPPAGLGLPVLADEEFDGLAIEIRFTARDPGGEARARSSWPARSGAVRSCSSPLVALGFRGGMMSRHSSLRGLLSRRSSQRSRNSARRGNCSRKAGEELFPPRGVDRVAALVISLILVPLGKSRLAGLLARACMVGPGRGLRCRVLLALGNRTVPVAASACTPLGHPAFSSSPCSFGPNAGSGRSGSRSSVPLPQFDADGPRWSR